MNQRALGVMSGTSADGIDVVLLEVADADVPCWPHVVAHAFLPYPDAICQQLVHPETLRAADIARLHFALAALYAEAVRLVPEWQSAHVVGLHGQTIVHEVGPAAPGPACTLQIGSSAVVAAALGLPVVGDMRAADVGLGGRGAPLVPFVHWFFLRGRNEQAAVVNFGGICNVTAAPTRLADVCGSDVGPGMMLSDAFARRSSHGARACDTDGHFSAGGRRIDGVFEQIVGHPFVQQALPKAGGREEFGTAFAQQLWAQAHGHPERDVAFTLLDATATILVQACARPPFSRHPLAAVYLTGGGAKNPTLQSLCTDRFAALNPDAQVRVATGGPLAPQHHEAAAMALIALRTAKQLPSGLPPVTGAERACVLGHVHAPQPARKFNFA